MKSLIILILVLNNAMSANKAAQTRNVSVALQEFEEKKDIFKFVGYLTNDENWNHGVAFPVLQYGNDNGSTKVPGEKVTRITTLAKYIK